jgi:excisionase family DNA binding protein
MAPGAKNVPDFTGQVMTADELCGLLRIHKSTLYRLIKKGNFPHFRIGTDYRFSREAIDEWRLAQGGQRPRPGQHGPKPHKAERA